MKRVLIITYYWPPSGGGGVMRWLKFTRYLPQYGWEPIIFTPENPDPSMIDESLLDEIPNTLQVIKIPIWEPYDIYRKLTGKSKSEKFKAGYVSEASGKGWKDKLSVFIRGNFMIPDPRKYWISPATEFLKTYLQHNPVDVIVTTGPPHSMHLIGLKIKQDRRISWLADFRDPWTNIDFYHKLRLTKWADQRHKKLEKMVLQSADKVITVSWGYAKNLECNYPRDVKVITNGYDPDDFKFKAMSIDKEFSITHIGSFNRDRNPETFWKVLGQLAGSNPVFKNKLMIRFAGQTDESVFESLKKNGLGDNIEDFGFISHSESLELLKRSQVLLLPLNDTPNVAGILPGKLYEYLASERPVIAIGPVDGDAAKILGETNTGQVAGFNDLDATKRIINQLYHQYMQHELSSTGRGIEQYSRKNLTGKLAALLDTLVS